MQEAINSRGKTYRILLIIRWPVGGIRTFLRYVLRNFESSIYKFTIIAPEGNELRALLEDLFDLDIEYVYVKENPSSLEFFFSIFRNIFHNRYDLIYSQGFTSGLNAILPAKLRCTPIMLTSHDVFLEEQFSGIIGTLKKICLCIIFPMFDLIHSVSYDAQENLLQFIPVMKLFKKRLIAIPNGIDVERFISGSKRDFKNELGLPDNVFLVGFFGRFMSQKGFKYLVDAIRIIKEFKLKKKPLVICFGESGFIREDRVYIQKEGLDEFFRFLPFTPNISESLKGLDVVAMPSLWEACPLLPMEAMVAGIPIIGTECIGLREVLRASPNVMLPVKNSEAIANALYNEIKKSTKDLMQKYIPEACQRFNVLHQARQLEKIIQDLTHERQSINMKK
ncbi:MAG TPA: glycosyltransferase family 4 protein [Bacteroidales bacterium]|nr:glycosyltransferase family 4 protein [Bacteroidales bacterium]